MKEILEEYGTAICGAVAGMIILVFAGYAFTDAHGIISRLLGGLIALYL